MEENIREQGGNLDELTSKLGLTPEELEDLAREIIEGEPEREKEKEVIQLEEEEAPKTQKRKFADIFDNVEELEKAYKNLQSKYTQERQKFKPFEQFIDLLQGNPEFAKFILQKTQEFFTGGGKEERKEAEFEEELWGEEKKSVGIQSKEELLNMIRNEISQALTAQRLIDDFRRAHPDVSDEELVQIINHAKNFGGDLETSYIILYKDKFKENLKRQVLEELKGHLSKKQTSPSEVKVQPSFEEAVAPEEDLWKLAVEVAKNPAKLKDLDSKTRATLLNILARQIL